jgi:hypothetical protein
MNSDKPQYVTALETSYGAPNQAGFGSTVFFEHINPADKLDMAALKKYKYFLGDLWERFGEDAWMSTWKQVYARPAGAKHDILAELNSVTDPAALNSIPMILDVVKDADKAKIALSAAYDDPAVVELKVFNTGDGAAMSGVLVAGRRNNGEAIYLVFLYD